MTIYHHDDSLVQHNHAGRTNAGMILCYAQSQNFDVSLQIQVSQGISLQKRYDAVLHQRKGRIILSVHDCNSTSISEIFIHQTMPNATIHVKAEELAYKLYQAFLTKVLLGHGFIHSR